MQWVNALSTRPSLEAALTEAIDRAQSQLQGDADVGFLFVSSMFASEYPRVMPLLRDRLSVPYLVGCGGGAIVGCNDQGEVQEVEDEPALSLCLAQLPGVKITPFWVQNDNLPDLDSAPQAWIDCLGVEPAESLYFIILADPYSSRANELLQGLDFAYPGAVKLGGLASGRPQQREGGLFFQDRYCSEGTIGLALQGNIRLRPIVAQGCRPIGSVLRVTQSDRNVLMQVQQEEEGQEATPTTPLDALQTLVQKLDASDRQLVQSSLFVGVACNEFQVELNPGDFLIRNLLGVDPRSGAIAVGDRVRPGQRIQFHLRDAQSSKQDLEILLRRYQRDPDTPAAEGALMFACLGRGESLYGELNFDSQLFRHYLGTVPMGGFFCNGEIGPLGDTTYLHGYTSVFAVFCAP